MAPEARIYLDHNGSTPVTPPVLDELRSFLDSTFGNAGAGHPDGLEASAVIGTAAGRIRAAIGAEGGELLFTSGGTESNNLAIFGATKALREAGDRRRHLVCGRHEHMSVVRPIEELERQGYRVTWIRPEACGRVSEETLEAAIRPDTALVSLMFANNETGVLQPTREMARLARAAGALSFVDAVCGAGKLPVDVRDIGCDLLSLSGHKLHAPKGVGVLFAREGVEVAPQIFGCGQQNGLRSGTENTLGAVALGAAAERYVRESDEAQAERESVRALRDRLYSGLLRAATGTSPVRNGHGTVLPGTLSVWFPGFDAVILERRLGAAGLSVKAQASMDPAYPKERKPSHVLKAMGASDARATESLRISLGKTTTTEDVDAALLIFQSVFKERLSPPAAGSASTPISSS